LGMTAPIVPPEKTTDLENLVSSHLLNGETVENLENWERELAKAVEEEMSERHLQISPEVTNKVSSIQPILALLVKS
jgi:hypothetical protein